MSALLLLAVVVLTLLNGFFVAAEFALVRARRGRIEELERERPSKSLRPALGGFLSHGVAVAVAVVFAYVVTTSLHVTVGEQVPKIMSIAHAERTIRAIARPLHAFSVGFRPFIVALNATSNAILRLLRVRPDQISEEGAGPEELKRLIAESSTGGALDAREAGMLSGV